MIRLRIDALAVLLIILAACESAPATDSRAAAANLASAQAQATITSQDATQVAAEANARLQQQYQQATQQAQAQQSAQQAAIDNLMIERARTDATASAQKSQAAVASSFLQVTAQAQQVAATQIVINATATAVKKAIDNSQSTADIYAAISLIATALVLIGGPLLIIGGVIVALHKWLARDGLRQPHPEGPAFAVHHGLLSSPYWDIIYDPRQPLLLESGDDDEEELPPAPPIRDSEIATMYDVQKWISASVNYKRYLARMGDFHNDKHNHGWDGHQLLTARECIAAGVFKRNGGKGESGGRDAAIKWLQEKHLARTENGNESCKTWDTLGSVQLAIAQALAPYSPASAIIDQKNDAGTLGEQGTPGNTREQPGTAGNNAEDNGNTSKAVPNGKYIPSDPIALNGAVGALPDWNGPHVPPKPSAPKQKAGLLRRVIG